MSGPYFKDLEKSRTEHGQRLVNGVLVFALAAKILLYKRGAGPSNP